MTNNTILISGAGIAGPTLAVLAESNRAPSQYWLSVRPHCAPAVMSSISGGLGYDIAERMGLLRDINRIGYHMRELRIVDDRGQRVTGFRSQGV